MIEEFSVPTLEEIERDLLTQLDERIAQCNRLKEHIRAVQGTPVTRERIGEWRKQARIDRASESCLRSCQRLYEMVLRSNETGDPRAPVFVPSLCHHSRTC